MKVGISTACFNFRQETESAVATIKDLGAECVEVYLRTFYEYRPEFAKELAVQLNGFEITSVCTERCNFERQLFSPWRRVRGDGFYWLDKLMNSAKILGCGNYVFRGCDFAEVADCNELAGYLRGVAEFCARFGVKPCLENNAAAIYNKPGIFRQLKNSFPELCGVFNLGQAVKSGYPYQMYIKDVADSVVGVKLCDRDINGNACLPGKGIFDFEQILKQLKDFGFDGAVIIESENFADNAELKTSLDCLKEIIYKIK